MRRNRYFLCLMFGLHTIQFVRYSWSFSISYTETELSSSPIDRRWATLTLQVLPQLKSGAPIPRQSCYYDVICIARYPDAASTISSPGFRYPGGDEGTRTPDLRRAKAALSQLSYIPKIMGLSGLEPETLPLSEARSNQLS